MTREIKYYLKHSMSCLSDQTFDVEVDDEARTVRIAVREFDSSLFTRVVCDLLPENGVVSYRDDNLPTEAWTTPAAPYSLVVRIGESHFRCQVVKLFSAKATVTLEHVLLNLRCPGNS
jgi:hypothetical protein